jgi:hypothetical protein
MQLTSSQQPSIKSANPNISPYSLLLYSYFLFGFSPFYLFFFRNKLFCLYSYLYVHMIWIIRVRVTSQLTVSQSVCLGVEPNLGLLTGDIIIIFFF